MEVLNFEDESKSELIEEYINNNYSKAKKNQIINKGNYTNIV